MSQFFFMAYRFPLCIFPHVATSFPVSSEDSHVWNIYTFHKKKENFITCENVFHKTEGNPRKINPDQHLFSFFNKSILREIYEDSK